MGIFIQISRRVISVNYCLLDELNNLKLFNEQHWESGVALELIGFFFLASVNASPVVPPYNEDENGGDDDELLQRGGRDEPHYYDPLNEFLEDNDALSVWIYWLNIYTKIKYRHYI